jgi:hypothetical protein
MTLIFAVPLPLSGLCLDNLNKNCPSEPIDLRLPAWPACTWIGSNCIGLLILVSQRASLGLGPAFACRLMPICSASGIVSVAFRRVAIKESSPTIQ